MLTPWSMLWQLNLFSWEVQAGLGTKQSNPGLPGHILRRVLERMNSEFCKDLSLATLAAESGYCRAHFLRIFRAATTQTPHQYLLSLRLQNAVRLMKERLHL